MGELDQDCVWDLCKVVVIQQVCCNLTDGCLSNSDCGLETRFPQGSSHKALCSQHHKHRHTAQPIIAFSSQASKQA